MAQKRIIGHINEKHWKGLSGRFLKVHRQRKNGTDLERGHYSGGLGFSCGLGVSSRQVMWMSISVLSVRLPFGGFSQNANHLHVSDVQRQFRDNLEICCLLHNALSLRMKSMGRKAVIHAQFTSKKHRHNLQAYYIFETLRIFFFFQFLGREPGVTLGPEVAVFLKSTF